MALVRQQGLSSYVQSIPCATGTGPGAKAAGMSGLGCPDCPCVGYGMGAFMDGTGLFGTGLFSSGLDPSTWGVGEYAALIVGGYVLLSVFHTTKSASSATRRKARAVKKGLFA